MIDNLIFETEYWSVFLADEQTYFGRIVVECKRNVPSLSELSEEEVLDFFDIVKKFENIMKQKFNATMFNWTCLMNNSYKKKPYTPHVHWHCRPRYDEPLFFKQEKFIDPDFSFHYNRELRREIPKDVEKEIIEELREYFLQYSKTD